MKNFNKTPNNADQSRVGDANRAKRETNLRKNTTLYFQVGLILCLLGVYGLFEMKFSTKLYAIEKVIIEGDDDFVIEPWKPEPKAVAEDKPKPQEQVVFRGQDTEIVDDDTADELITALLDPDLGDHEDSFDINSMGNPDDLIADEIEKPFSIIGVEQVPIYPGCEYAKGNDELRKCMSDKLTKLIQKKFNPDVADGYNLSGIQRIAVQFRIDKNGIVTDIKTRAPNAKLEKEAERVMNKIPKMIPGKQHKKPVSVMYNLPIIYKVQN